MAHTVIGIFDNASEAQTAVEQLISKGFSRSNIDLSAGMGSDATDSDALIPDRHVNSLGTRTEEIVDDTKDVGSSVGGFFSSLFGSDGLVGYGRACCSLWRFTLRTKSGSQRGQDSIHQEPLQFKSVAGRWSGPY